MNFYNKFFTLLLLFAFNISADELTINLSGQTKEGVLSLAIYDNAEAYNYSVKGEKRSEEGVFSGLETFIEPKESHEFVINLPEGIYAIALFVDTNKRFQIDDNKIENAINKKTKAIIPVHWAGASPNMSKIISISKKYNIPVVEDACMGIGAMVNNKAPGTFGKVNAFSMHPLKSLNVMGDGGMITTNDDKIAEWIFKYRNHGMIDRDHIELWGVNSRLQPLQAIVAMHGLKDLKKIIKKRNNNALILDKGLSKIKSIQIPTRIKNNIETFALYMGLFDDRDRLLNYLIKNNIEAKIHYPIPLHLQKAAKNLKYRKGSFPIAEKQAKKLITLPVHQYLNSSHMHYMIKKINQFYKI